jgi:hypothetical protein
MTTAYTIDRNDRIVDLSPDWDGFATANNGSGACAAHVMGRPLFDSIDGDPVRMFMHAVLMRVRASGVLEEVPYRCDSETARRFFRMTLEPVDGGAVRVAHILDREEPMERTVRIRTADEPFRAVPRCSLCCRLKLDGAWADPFEADEDSDVRVIHTVCPDCKAAGVRRASPAQPLGIHMPRG